MAQLSHFNKCPLLADSGHLHQTHTELLLQSALVTKVDL